MKKIIYILSITLLFGSCSNNQSSEQNQNPQNVEQTKNFASDETAFIHSLELFKDAQLGAYAFVARAQEMTANFTKQNNKDSVAAFYERYKKEHLASINKYKEVISESEKVSDDFLNEVNPQLKSVYRDKFIEAMKITYREGVEGINNDYSDADLKNAAQSNQKTDEMITEFWKYISSIQDELQSKHPAIAKAIIKIISE
jgi:hypothetical protein